MTLIPHFVQNEVGTDAASRLSAWNFCNPFDHILPPVDNSVSALDRQHLWGMYVGIAAASAAARRPRAVLMLRDPGRLAPGL